eukprot:353872-Chlamydomonas_euryale.AAC.8
MAQDTHSRQPRCVEYDRPSYSRHYRCVLAVLAGVLGVLAGMRGSRSEQRHRFWLLGSIQFCFCPRKPVIAAAARACAYRWCYTT